MAGASAGAGATVSVATVASAGEDSSTASSSSSPAHRCRTICHVAAPSGPGPERVADTQLAAIGRPVSAPRWAITSLPRSVPAASTASAPVWLTSPARTRAHASGAYPASWPGSVT